MTDSADLAASLGALAGARVLVVGDVMLDRFVYGTVERISPEAPIPVLKIAREATMLGGAGNVLRNLAALGAHCGIVGVVGDDAAGREVQTLAAATADSGVGCRLIARAERPTTIKERFIAGGQQLLRSDREASGALDPAAARTVIEAAREAMSRLGEASGAARADAAPGALILSDYGKGALAPATAAALIEAARAAGWSVVVDPKGRDFGVYRGADLVTPNRRELAEASGQPAGTDAQVVAACRAVIASAGLGGVLATRSEQGMTLVLGGPGADREGDPGGAHHFAAEAREVFDVSGAGDTVVAVLAAGLAAGVAPALAARLANVAAGIVVGKLGTAVARPAEILHAIHASDLLAAEAKVVDCAESLERVQRWRQTGQRVGFTNGCFDLLHPGHVSLLAQARRACDRLVVGLNGDESVRRLKGANRPIQSESARAAVLGSLASVDLVVVFGEDTPLALIEALRPDVLVKGADYGLEDVVGADLVQGYGGRVVLAELAPGFSTTETIRKLSG